MPAPRRLDIRNRKKIFKDLETFINTVAEKFSIREIYIFGSLARGELHEGSDIDLLIVGDISGRFFEKIGKVLKLTDLPIEPLVYTETEFIDMKDSANPLICNVIKTGIKIDRNMIPLSNFFNDLSR